MSSFVHPIIGQECVVPTYGLGRVTGFVDNMPDIWIGVRPYEANFICNFEPKNVRLVKINFEK